MAESQRMTATIEKNKHGAWHVLVERAGWGRYSGLFDDEQAARAELARQVARARPPAADRAALVSEYEKNHARCVALLKAIDAHDAAQSPPTADAGALGFHCEAGDHETCRVEFKGVATHLGGRKVPCSCLCHARST